MRLLCLVLLVQGLAGCSQPPDLDSPCPNYGRTCAQTAINLQPLF